MAIRDTLNQSMDNAVKHYASLFKLPSYRKVVLLEVLICLGGGLLFTFMRFRSSESLLNGLVLGASLFLIGFVFDYIANVLVLGSDPIYDLRRMSTVSLFCWGLWFFFVFVGAVVGASLGLTWWVRLCLLGFSAVTTFRLVVFRASSSVRQKRLVIAAFLQPFFCLLPFMVLWTQVGHVVTINMLLFLAASFGASLVSTHVFLSLLDHVGQETVEVPALALFRAFLLNWVVDLNAPFEEFLEKLGEEQDVEMSVVKFDSPKPKAVIAVPSVHPGPFKNIGSSILPFLLKDALEKRLGYVACVPLGLQSHELDLASQVQNQKVINKAVESMGFEASELKASPFVKASDGLATACCQVFGDFAFLSFTLAPNTTEDMPQELGVFVRQESEKHGLKCCVVTNAHNSIDGTLQMPEALDAMKKAATASLQKAISLKQVAFEVGASTKLPKEFSLRDGMGAGGITAIVVKVGEQKTAYVVMDGNNMVSGLREKILSALHTIGIAEGEVFTTDTHSVSAVILGERGYHPIGEAMNHETLVDYIKEVTINAVSNLERARIGCRSITIPQVKVIGEKRLETLSLLTDKVLRRAREVVVPIFLSCGLVLMLLLLFV